MKQKNLLLKGILALLLVFAVAFAGCNNGTTETITLDDLGVDRNPQGNLPADDGPEEIKNIEVDELEDVSIEAMDGAGYGLTGAYGFELSWVPVASIGKYEVWREDPDGKNKELVAATGASGYMEPIQDKAKGLFFARDYLKLNKEGEPTLVEDNEYIYTVIAIPIATKVRDTSIWKSEPIAAPAMIAKGTPVGKPVASLRIDAAAYEAQAIIGTLTAATGFTVPIDEATYSASLAAPNGSNVSGFNQDGANLKWVYDVSGASWRTIPQGVYTMTASVKADDFFNGFFADATADAVTATHKQLFLPKAAALSSEIELDADWGDSNDPYLMSNGGSVYEGFIVTIDLASLRGLERPMLEGKDIIYAIERAAPSASDASKPGAFAPIVTYRTGALSEGYGSGYIKVETGDLIPDIFGTFWKVDSTVFDQSIPFDITKDSAWFYRIKGVFDGGAAEDYVYSAKVEVEPSFDFTSLFSFKVSAAVEFTATKIDDEDGNASTSVLADGTTISYIITPWFIEAVDGLLGANDTMDVYWKIGGPGEADIYKTGGYGKNTGTTWQPYGMLSIGRADILARAGTELEIDIMQFAYHFEFDAEGTENTSAADAGDGDAFDYIDHSAITVAHELVISVFLNRGGTLISLEGEAGGDLGTEQDNGAILQYKLDGFTVEGLTP